MMVTVYEKDKCTACTNTKRKLEDVGLPYETADLMEPMNLAAAKALRHMSAPVVVVGDDSWSGFRPDKIDELVKQLELQEEK